MARQRPDAPSTAGKKCLLIPMVVIESSERPTVPARRDGLQVMWEIPIERRLP